MPKKIFLLLLSFVLWISITITPAAKDILYDTKEKNGAQTVFAPIECPSLSAESAILMCGDGSTVICGKNADKRMAMASTTKIMTALVAARNFDLQKEVKVDAAAVGVEGSSIYLYAGERMTMEDLLYAMLLESANDAAAAIAIAVGGSIDGFCDMMNDCARELGLSDTHFTNPHGLYDEDHYTTARELAIIAAEALSDPTVKKIVATKKHTITPIEGNVRVLYNHNKMLSRYDGAIGVKTGFTKKSGRCLVSAAERDGFVLIAVTLNASDDWNDHTKLLDTGFENFERVVFASKGNFNYSLPVTGGVDDHVILSNTDELSAILPKGNAKDAECVIETVNRFEFAPVKPNQVGGRVSYIIDGKIIASSDLVFISGTEKLENKEGFFEKIKNIFS